METAWFILLVGSVGLILGVAGAGIAFASAQRAVKAARLVDSAHRLADRLLLVEDNLASLRETMERVDTRTRMREARAAKANKNGGDPDWRTDPEGFLAFHESRLGIRR